MLHVRCTSGAPPPLKLLLVAITFRLNINRILLVMLPEILKCVIQHKELAIDLKVNTNFTFQTSGLLNLAVHLFFSMFASPLTVSGINTC